MNIIGLVAEFNPFHNGHKYMIKEIKKKYPNSLIIVCLNGYFLQRGEISFISKEDKVKTCLDEDINIVLELPVIYGTQSSDIFAYESIKILNMLHIDTLIFGSESANLDTLKQIANYQEKEEYQIKVKEYLDNGLNYPTALAKSLNCSFDFLPNDLLGISYIKAINKINSNINIDLIKRTSSYHDLTSSNDIISASNIRNKFQNNESVSKYTPYSKYLIHPNYNTYFKLLKSKILTSSNLSNYLDVIEGIDYRLKSIIKDTNSLEDLISNTKSKRYTYNRINRMFIHILLDIKSSNPKSSYLRVLGFNSIGQKYLSSLDLDYNSYKNTDIYNLELTSSLIYDLINDSNTYLFEKSNKPIIKKDLSSSD